MSSNSGIFLTSCSVLRENAYSFYCRSWSKVSTSKFLGIFTKNNKFTPIIHSLSNFKYSTNWHLATVNRRKKLSNNVIETEVDIRKTQSRNLIQWMEGLLFSGMQGRLLKMRANWPKPCNTNRARWKSHEFPLYTERNSSRIDLFFHIWIGNCPTLWRQTQIEPLPETEQTRQTGSRKGNFFFHFS